MTWLGGDRLGLYRLPHEEQVELLALWEMTVEGARRAPARAPSSSQMPPPGWQADSDSWTRAQRFQVG